MLSSDENSDYTTAEASGKDNSCEQSERATGGDNLNFGDSEEAGSDSEHLSLSEKLLQGARHGQTEIVREVLSSSAKDGLVDVNCKGSKKSNKGWTALHLAAYFGHEPIVQLLGEFGADVNLSNDAGDTALHKATFTGRLGVVTFLLKSRADVLAVNLEGKTPRALAKDQEVLELLQASEVADAKVTEAAFLSAAANGDVDEVQILLNGMRPPNVNCMDGTGNTALHCASLGNHLQVAIALLQSGAKSHIENTAGHIPLGLASTEQMKQILVVKPLKEISRAVQKVEGELLKRTKVLGWRSRWVVLDKGVLSVFKSRADAVTGSFRKTFKYLDDAGILVTETDPKRIVIRFSDRSRHFYRTLPEDNAVIKQRWINGLRSHMTYADSILSKGADLSDSDDDMVAMGDDLLHSSSVGDSLQIAQAHLTMVGKAVDNLKCSMSLVYGAQQSSTEQPPLTDEVLEVCSVVIKSAKDTHHSLTHSLTLAKQLEEFRQNKVALLTEKCRVLEESLQILATEHLQLEERWTGGTGGDNYCYSPRPLTPAEQEGCGMESDEEFFDCEADKDDSSASVDLSMPGAYGVENYDDYPQGPTDVQSLSLIQKRSHSSRITLPVPVPSRSHFSVWNVLKQCIGKELSKVTMPVIFNEPISFLQRIAEYLEYSYLLERASFCQSPQERLQYVTAFAVSACASNFDRLGKPFNPLLGETYELSREELGFKIVCEQVSHHPPVSAFHAESKDFKFYGTIHPKLRFWGKTVEITPKGLLTVELLKHGEVYSWENVNVSVHNIIVGKLWVEHHGLMEVTNHTNGYKAELNFKKSGLLSREAHKVEGVVLDNRKTKLGMLYGSWTDALFCAGMSEYEKCMKSDQKSKKMFEGDAQLSVEGGSEEESDAIPKRPSSYDLRLSSQRCLWQADDRPESAKQFYSFTLFTMMLNDLAGFDMTLDPNALPGTDCRLRPDIRELENGNVEAAAVKKLQLEEKQRAGRKTMKKAKDEWSPRWFTMSRHPVTKKDDWLYTGKYWDKDWSSSPCPDIF